MSGAWVRLFDASTPWADVEAIVEEQTAIALDDVRVQIAAMPDMTAIERAAAVALIAPLVRAQTRSALRSAWLGLQAEDAAADLAGVVH